VVEIEHQIEELDGWLSAYPEFVVKPAHGSGGDGALVVAGRSKSLYRSASGVLMDQPEVDHCVSNILSGLLAWAVTPTPPLIEYRVQYEGSSRGGGNEGSTLGNERSP
jgi:putative polysaccharide biosynthesis protein